MEGRQAWLFSSQMPIPTGNAELMFAMFLTLSALADLSFSACREASAEKQHQDLQRGKSVLLSHVDLGAAVLETSVQDRRLRHCGVGPVLLPLLSWCAVVVSASSLLQGQVADLSLQGSLRQQPAWLTAAITESGLSECALGGTVSGQIRTPGGANAAATMLLQYNSSVWLKSCSCTVRWVNAPSGHCVLCRT